MTMLKKSEILLLIVLLLVVMLCAYWYFDADKVESTSVLPAKNSVAVIKQASLANDTACPAEEQLYGSNQDLSNLLTQIDIHFKSHRFNSDFSAPVYEYADSASGELVNDVYVDFKYEGIGIGCTAIATFYPRNPIQLTENHAVNLEQITNLQQEFQYVYSISVR